LHFILFERSVSHSASLATFSVIATCLIERADSMYSSRVARSVLPGADGRSYYRRARSLFRRLVIHTRHERCWSTHYSRLWYVCSR